MQSKEHSEKASRPSSPLPDTSPVSLQVQGAVGASSPDDERRPYSSSSFSSTATSLAVTNYDSQYLPEVLERERRARQQEDDEHARLEQEVQRMRRLRKTLGESQFYSFYSPDQSSQPVENVEGVASQQDTAGNPPRPRQDSLATTLGADSEELPQYTQHRIRRASSTGQLYCPPPPPALTRNSIVSSSLKRVSRALTLAGRTESSKPEYYPQPDPRFCEQGNLTSLKNNSSSSTNSCLNLNFKSSDMTGDDESTRPPHKSENDSIFSRLPDEAQRDPSEITYPDGGFNAWVQVFAAFLLLCTGWGIVVSYGVFETYYGSLNPPLANSAGTALIGSIQAFLLLFVGFFTGFCGMTYWKILFCQGIITGTGMGFLFTPSVAVVSTYFYKKRALANGIVASGSSVGGIMFPILTRKLIPAIGFRNTMIVNSSIVLTLLIISNLILAPRKDIPPRRKGPMIDVKSFKDLTYMLFVFGMLAAFLGLYMPFFYIEVWAKRMGLDKNGLETFYLISILNGASTFGRVVPNFFADRVGSINMQIPAMVVSGILILCWLPIKTFAGMLVFVVLYGFFSGVFISLPPASVASITPDVTFFGVRMGMMFSIASVGSLTGTPISGALIHAQGGNLDTARVWSGCIMLFSAALIIAARINASGLRWRYKI
ncbi:hypothetical protein ABW21_db0200667 [Orbilia brochopaga]|nr:hypothetical protein ABW21_db0200667 [Drechslerella brochopaga]